MGIFEKKKNEKIEEVKTEEKVSEDTNTPVEEENATVEDGEKLDETSPVVEPVSEVENEVVEENDEVEEEKVDDKIIIDDKEIPLDDNSILEEELCGEPTELSNFIFLLEDIINSNQSTEFDTVNLKNQIRTLIAEFK